MKLPRSQLVLSFLGLVLFAGSLWVISQQLRQHNFFEVINSLRTIPSSGLVFALVLTALSYLVLTAYDILACHHVRHPLPHPKVVLAAFLGHAISNSVGFALLTSTAVRYRLYSSWGLSAIEIAQVIAFSNVSFWLGLFAVGGVGFVAEPLTIPTLLHLPFTSVHPLGWLFLSLVIAYMLGSYWLKRPFRFRKWKIAFPSPRLASIQLLIAALDWVLAGGVLYVLLQPKISLSYSSFFGIYLLAQLAGIISHVPGGLGVFETVILWFLSSVASATTVFGTLLAYRFIYYLLPLGMAMLLLGLYEISQRLRSSKR